MMKLAKSLEVDSKSKEDEMHIEVIFTEELSVQPVQIAECRPMHVQ